MALTTTILLAKENSFETKEQVGKQMVNAASASDIPSPNSEHQSIDKRKPSSHTNPYMNKTVKIITGNFKG